MSKVSTIGALGCAMVFAIGMLLMASASYAGHRGHGGHRAHGGGHGIHHGVHRGVRHGGINRGLHHGVHRGVHRGVYRHGRYYGGYGGWGVGGVGGGGGGVVINGGRYDNCRWVRAHYNSSGYYVPARRVCRYY